MIGDDLALISDAAHEAGEIAMRYFRKDPDVWYKSGASPVSEADIAVNTFLHTKLRQARPDYGWLSEETVDDSSRLEGKAVFVVDPIDGTRAFVNGDDVWCVSIAVVLDGRTIAGVLACPAREEFFASGLDGSAIRNNQLIQVARPDNRVQIAAPENVLRRLPEEFMRGRERARHIPSLAYRIAMVADGRLAATLIRPHSHDWDLAAADLILHNAGGAIVDTDGAPLLYNRNEVTHGLLVAAPTGFLPAIHEALSGIDL